MLGGVSLIVFVLLIGLEEIFGISGLYASNSLAGLAQYLFEFVVGAVVSAIVIVIGAVIGAPEEDDSQIELGGAKSP